MRIGILILVVVFIAAGVTGSLTSSEPGDPAAGRYPDGWTATTTPVSDTIRVGVPDGAEADNAPRQALKIQETGDEQPANTEVVDGYTVWVREIRKGQVTESPDRVAWDIYEKNVTEQNKVEPFAAQVSADRSIYTFAHTSKLGNTVHHALWRIPGNSYIHVTYSISAPTDTKRSRYQQTVDQIIENITTFNR